MMRTRSCAIAVLLVVGATSAWAGLGKYKGQIVVSDQAFPALNDDGDKAAADLKKIAKDKLERPKDSDGWTFNMMAFLDRRPQVATLSLMFYDVTDGKREFLTSRDISCDPNADILASEIDVSGDDIKDGHKIEIALTKVVGDKETELAKTRVTFVIAK